MGSAVVFVTEYSVQDLVNMKDSLTKERDEAMEELTKVRAVLNISHVW